MFLSVTVGGRIRCVMHKYHDQLSWENFFDISGLRAKLNVSSQSVFFCFKRMRMFGLRVYVQRNNVSLMSGLFHVLNQY